MVLAALVRNGDIILSLPGKKIDASNLDELVRIGPTDASNFKHLEAPKDLPLAQLQALFDFLGLPKGLISNAATREDAVRRLHERADDLVRQIVEAQALVQGGLPCWGIRMLSELEQENYRKQLDSLKTMLESLQPFTTPAKLKNFGITTSQINGQKSGLNVLKQVQEIAALVQEAAPILSYLSTAEALLPADSKWAQTQKKERGVWVPKLADPEQRAVAGFRQQFLQKLTELRNVYVDQYLLLHKKARLNASEDERKASLLKDPRLGSLRKLANIDLLPKSQLVDLQNRLAGLKTCFNLIKDELQTDPKCPHCSFRPAEETVVTSPASALDAMDDELDKLVADWTKTLLNNLSDTTIKQAVSLLKPQRRTFVENFIKQKALPGDMGADFTDAVQEVLSGLEKVDVRLDDVRQALLAGGIPCTLAELQKRFENYTKSVTKGKDLSKIRITITG